MLYSISPKALRLLQEVNPNNIVVPNILTKRYAKYIEDLNVADNFLDLDNIVIRFVCVCGIPSSVTRQLVGKSSLGYPYLYWTFNHGEIPMVTWKQGNDTNTLLDMVCVHDS